MLPATSWALDRCRNHIRQYGKTILVRVDTDGNEFVRCRTTNHDCAHGLTLSINAASGNGELCAIIYAYFVWTPPQIIFKLGQIMFSNGAWRGRNLHIEGTLIGAHSSVHGGSR